MARRKKIHVRCDTMPNGYVLTVNKREYMAFNEKELSAAVFYHVLLGNEEYVDKNISENLMTAAATWPTVHEAIEGNATLMAEIQDAKRETRVSRMQNNRLCEKIDALNVELKELKSKYIKAKAKADQMEKYKQHADVAYELYNKEKKLSSNLHKELVRLQRREDSRIRAQERKIKKDEGEDGGDAIA